MESHTLLLQGPRFKSDATRDLEAIAKTLLKNPRSIRFFYNDSQELQADLNGTILNIAHILKNKPDFEHFQFSRAELCRYAKFYLTHYKADYFAQLFYRLQYEYHHYNYRPVCLDDMSHLTEGERFAIQRYTTQHEDLQYFLFNHGTVYYTVRSSEFFSEVVADIILTICIASYALSQPNASPRKEELICHRLETVDSSDDFFKKKKEAAEKQEIYTHMGFTSFNHWCDPWTIDFKKSNCRIKTLSPAGENTLGKRIDHTSLAMFEDEVLFPPGIQFLYTEYQYREEKNSNVKHHFVCTPVRSLDGIDPFSYRSPLPKKSYISSWKISIMFFSASAMLSYLFYKSGRFHSPSPHHHSERLGFFSMFKTVKKSVKHSEFDASYSKKSP